MKKLVFALATLAFGSLNAAVIYNDFAPDYTMSLGGTLSFDLDGDNNDDITFTSTGTGGSNYVISASGSQLEFATQTGAGMAYTESLFVGKLIDANKNWTASNARIASGANKDIAGGSEFYIGIRVVNTNGGFFYGWLLMEVKSNYELHIKSAAFETNSPKIVAGNTGAALLSVEANQLMESHIYPNVVQDQLTVESKTTIKEIKVLNMNGQLVKNQMVEAEKTILEMTDLARGSYLVRLEDESGNVYQKRILKK